jgi:hypothetical protein
VNPFYLAPVLQLPQIILPGKQEIKAKYIHTNGSTVGQKQYLSRVSGNEEYLPIVTGLVGAKGCDLMLVNLAKAVLESNSWPVEVKTGRYMFGLAGDVGNVALRTEGPEGKSEQQTLV